MSKKITIVTPVFNDWDCLQFLLSDLKKILNQNINKIQVIAVNDSSTQLPNETIKSPENINLEIIDLLTNLGHQRAIMVGLCYCMDSKIDSDYIIVMDSDGEDKPKYIKELLEKCDTINQKEVVFAKRSKRSETWSFKLFYQLYKMIFKILTGQSISFGNFSCIPKTLLPKICNDTNFWNHYSAAMIKSNIPYCQIPTIRGKRYFGNSKMNINSLILHGLSSLSVYIESIIIRTLKLSFTVFLFLIFALSLVICIKYFTTYAIPGWATYVFGFIFNLLITIGLFNLLIILSHLNNRNKPISRPLDFYKSLIKK